MNIHTQLIQTNSKIFHSHLLTHLSKNTLTAPSCKLRQDELELTPLIISRSMRQKFCHFIAQTKYNNSPYFTRFTPKGYIFPNIQHIIVMYTCNLNTRVSIYDQKQCNKLHFNKPYCFLSMLTKKLTNASENKCSKNLHRSGCLRKVDKYQPQ